jgi:signal transduction histidine kinase
LCKISVNDYFNDICEELKLEVEGSCCTFKYNNTLKQDYIINIDVFKLKRVFTNIFNNSIKYAGDNCFIFCLCKKVNRDIVFELSDNGNGVPEEQLTKIFDRFYRIDTSRSRENGGTGLGLAICKDIISNHGGKIGAENNEIEGLKIWFSVPIV